MGKKDVRFGDATIGLTLQYHVFAHLALSSLAKCKNGTHGNENLEIYFWYFGSLANYLTKICYEPGISEIFFTTTIKDDIFGGK